MNSWAFGRGAVSETQWGKAGQGRGKQGIRRDREPEGGWLDLWQDP